MSSQQTVLLQLASNIRSDFLLIHFSGNSVWTTAIHAFLYFSHSCSFPRAPPSGLVRITCTVVLSSDCSIDGFERNADRVYRELDRARWLYCFGKSHTKSGCVTQHECVSVTRSVGLEESRTERDSLHLEEEEERGDVCSSRSVFPLTYDSQQSKFDRPVWDYRRTGRYRLSAGVISNSLPHMKEAWFRYDDIQIHARFPAYPLMLHIWFEPLEW